MEDSETADPLRMYCDTCGYVSYTEENLMIHIRVEHDDEFEYKEDYDDGPNVDDFAVVKLEEKEEEGDDDYFGDSYVGEDQCDQILSSYSWL